MAASELRSFGDPAIHASALPRNSAWMPGSEAGHDGLNACNI
jgi:hypothetical protein